MKPAFELEGITYRPELRLIDNERIILEDRGEEREARFRKSREGLLEVHFDEHHYQVWYSVPSHERIFLTINSINFEVRRKDILPSQGEFSNPEGTSGNLGYVVSPMPGKVISVNVTEGDKVSKGDLLAIVEAMKMENNIQSPVDGIVDRIDVKPGMMVDGNTRLVHFRQNE